MPVDTLMLLYKGFPGALDRRVARTERLVQVDRKIEPLTDVTHIGRRPEADFASRIVQALQSTSQ